MTYRSRRKLKADIEELRSENLNDRHAFQEAARKVAEDHRQQLKRFEAFLKLTEFAPAYEKDDGWGNTFIDVDQFLLDSSQKWEEMEAERRIKERDARLSGKKLEE